MAGFTILWFPINMQMIWAPYLSRNSGHVRAYRGGILGCGWEGGNAGGWVGGREGGRERERAKELNAFIVAA